MRSGPGSVAAILSELHQKRELIENYFSNLDQDFYVDQLYHLISQVSEKPGTMEGQEIQSVKQSIVAMINILVHRLTVDAKVQGFILNEEDIPSINSGISHVFSSFFYEDGENSLSIDQLGVWDKYVGLAIFEAKTIVLADCLVGPDAFEDLAKTAVVNELGLEDQKDLIQSFTRECRSRIDQLFGVALEDLEILEKRLVGYANHQFPDTINFLSDAESCLGYISEKLGLYMIGQNSNFKTFLQNIEHYEVLALKYLSSYDGLFQKHFTLYTEMFSDCLPKNSQPTSLLDLKKTLFQVWLAQSMEDDNEASGETEIHAGVPDRNLN